MVELSGKKYPVLNDQYTLCKQLGEGQTSKVYLAKKINNKDEKVAVKVMKKEYLASGDEAKKSIVSEIKILEQIRHDSIVSI
jgi:serine/threonine protein kinase